MNPQPGQLIAEHYRLERKLGAGGMGVVWSAVQELTRRPVALKFLHHADENPLTRKRFLREARAACAVRHPNVVQVLDVLLLEEDGTPCIVMERLEGESLATKLRREKKVSADDLARLMLPVISAVGTAHAHGVVHRDLKPDNIFVSSDGTVKVLDFGIAKLMTFEADEQTAGLTNTGAMLGTPYYMSPEQAYGERDVDHRTDIWALGIIFYRLLTGVLPTQRENVGQVLKIILNGQIPKLAETAPELPKDLSELIDRMLSSDRSRRPHDLREVQSVLRRYADVPASSFGEPIAPVAIDSSREIANGEDGDDSATRVDDTQEHVVPEGARRAAQGANPGETVGGQTAEPRPPGRIRWRAAAFLAAGFVGVLGVGGLAGRLGADRFGPEVAGPRTSIRETVPTAMTPTPSVAPTSTSTANAADGTGVANAAGVDAGPTNEVSAAASTSLNAPPPKPTGIGPRRHTKQAKPPAEAAPPVTSTRTSNIFVEKPPF